MTRLFQAQLGALQLDQDQQLRLKGAILPEQTRIWSVAKQRFLATITSTDVRRGSSSLIGNYRDPHTVVTLINRKAHRQKLLDHGNVGLRMRAKLSCCK